MSTDRTRTGVSSAVRCEFQCFRPGCGKWLAGGLTSFARHMKTVHGIDDMTPKTRSVDRHNNLVGANGKPITKGPNRTPVPASRKGLDGWLRSVIWYGAHADWTK